MAESGDMTCRNEGLPSQNRATCGGLIATALHDQRRGKLQMEFIPSCIFEYIKARCCQTSVKICESSSTLAVYVAHAAVESHLAESPPIIASFLGSPGARICILST